CADVTPTPVPPFTGKLSTLPESCYQEGEQVLVGYQVNNTVNVKVRNLDVVGQVVDAAALAGGDVTRVNYVSFTVEDSKAAQAAAREEAVKDALAKARQFAQLTGVKLGRLLYIAESGGVSPTPVYRAEAFAGAPDKAATTPISAGELDVNVSVQAVFAIE
ncbi:MAG: SIMPL domain-containing protein, partial [Chloroflexota bacterium]|nr:SIMPL domain-containing protein [Chloroflexota bacterium]